MASARPAWAFLATGWIACLAMIGAQVVDPGIVERSRGWKALIVPILYAFVVPSLLYAGLRGTAYRFRRRGRALALGGATTGIWFSALWAALPYIGGYPSLPVVLFALAAAGGSHADPVFILTLSLANLLLWTAVLPLLPKAYAVVIRPRRG